MKKSNLNKILFNVFKIAIIAIALIYIYFKLKSANLLQITNSLKNLSTTKYFLFALLFFLMFVNWFIEAVKWKFLVSKTQKINLATSIKAVLSGLTVSVFTPNRVGEYFGRIFVLRKRKRINGIIATIVGSYSQVLITLIIGSVALVTAINFNEIHNRVISKTLLSLIIIAVNIGLIFFYFRVKLFYNFFKRFKIIRRNKHKINILKKYSFKELIKVLYLSFFRYAVFVNQFFILLYIFDVNIQYEEAIFSIALTYLVSAVVPSFMLSDIGIKTSVSIYFISMFTDNVSGAFAAILLLWIINIAIPAGTAGSFFLAKQKI